MCPAESANPFPTSSDSTTRFNKEAMETFPARSGFISCFDGENVSICLWRPWTREENNALHTTDTKHGGLSGAKTQKTLQVTHPVKLYWPKSKCFDYMYQDAEMLLLNYPVQAAICIYEDSSDEESDDEEDDEDEKDLK